MARDPGARAAIDPAAILDQLATAILVVDASASVTWLNAAAADLLAVGPAAACGRPFASLLTEGSAIESLIARSRESQEPLALRGIVLAPAARGDSRHQVDICLTPLAGSVLIEIADTTQPSRMTRDSALLAQQGGSRVMARQLAHEIKNPLGGLRGAAQLLARALTHATIGAERHRVVASLQFEDDGPGVPAELGETIFYPLVTARPGGTGLGLAVAQDIATRHGGIIEFDSRPGRTVFSLLLPMNGPMENGHERAA